jgi:anti-sigma28 factor (negative regulator of flagellin synthesis)
MEDIMRVQPIIPITPISKITKSSETGITNIVIDRSDLSSESTIMSKVYQEVIKEDKARKDKLEDIKKRVEKGIYEINENMVNVIIDSIVVYTA